MKASTTHWSLSHLQTEKKTLCFTWLTLLTGHGSWVRPSHTGCHTRLYGLQPPQRHVSLAWVTALLWPQEINAELWSSPNDLIKIKYNRGGGGGGDEGGGDHWGNSRPTPSDFLRNESVEETCQRSAAFLSHTLLIVAGEVFNAEKPKKTTKKNPQSGRKNTASAYRGDTTLNV